MALFKCPELLTNAKCIQFQLRRLPRPIRWGIGLLSRRGSGALPRIQRGETPLILKHHGSFTITRIPYHMLIGCGAPGKAWSGGADRVHNLCHRGHHLPVGPGRPLLLRGSEGERRKRAGSPASQAGRVVPQARY